MRSQPTNSRVYRPECPRVVVSGWRLRTLSEAEIAEWYRKLDRILEERADRAVQVTRIG